MQNGHVQHAGEGLGEERLAAAGRPDEQDVRLLELDLVDRGAGVDPLVVVVDGDREDLLGPLLADHVLVERVLDLVRVRELGASRPSGAALEHLLLDDLLAEVDALVADVDALACDELADLLLALAAEGAPIRDLGSLGAAARRRHCLSRPATGPWLFFGPGSRRLAAAASTSAGVTCRSLRRRPARHRAPARSASPLDGVDRVDDAIVLACLGRHEVVPVRVLDDLLHRLAGVPGEDLVVALDEVLPLAASG